MDEETLKDLVRWFSGYVQTFKVGYPEADRNIILKEEHTARVRREIREIGLSLGLSGEDLCLAEAAAILHDLGRFPQYARYKTFSDRRSCDHAALSVQVLSDSFVLDDLEPSERDLILKAISYHNRAHIPEYEEDRCIFFTKLLRDADKLDVWALLLDYYSRRAGEGCRNGALELDLPDAPGISEEVCRAISAGEIVKVRDLNSLNDFKLLQASWIFDINFWPALVEVAERGYLERTREVLSRSQVAERIIDLLKSRLAERIEAESPQGPD